MVNPSNPWGAAHAPSRTGLQKWIFRQPTGCPVIGKQNRNMYFYYDKIPASRLSMLQADKDLISATFRDLNENISFGQSVMIRLGQ